MDRETRKIAPVDVTLRAGGVPLSQYEPSYQRQRLAEQLLQLADHGDHSGYDDLTPYQLEQAALRVVDAFVRVMGGEVRVAQLQKMEPDLHVRQIPSDIQGIADIFERVFTP